MSESIDRGTLERLIARGRDRGELSAEDLRAALPVERMEVDDLVLVMLELEAAGISVEPEAFGPPADTPLMTALTLPPRDPGPIPPIRAGEGADAVSAPTASESQPAPPPRADPDDGTGVNRAVILAGLMTLLVLGAVLLLL
ncbi:RNA polymerase sigma factor region1.1 domain-containing protein [Methylobacterium sp. J-030]|uniref:RNA polymerase sigma factor region1.1 domain-containing protein n=1 Tax=Methylobacterium sp. J-030 TaxID=2836627 RepID=UPI001FBB9838|nr:RNA polymerase sigma factor region1.1 domain-containing protein [Methylobacterium sp. J-030]MCJ2072301.1 RNA polymerase sigma factor region1.1 domain-containing protein [Methylobacterium sp. J-030]